MAQTKQVDTEVFERMPVPRAVRSFVGPALISSSITIIYSLADAFFVGAVGDKAQMAGLALAFPYYQYLQAFSNLWGVGANTVMSVALGRGDRERVSRTSAYGFWGGAIFTLAFCAVLFSLQRTLLGAAGADASTLGYAISYFNWAVVIGGLPTVLSIVMANLLRAEGHAKAASFGLVVGGILNCIFDPLFISVLGMGVTGAAIATALTDLIAFLILLNHYRKIRETTLISLVPPRGRIVWENLRDIVLSGLPSGWLTFLGASGAVVQSNCYAIVGTEAVAGWGIVNRIIFIVIYATHGIAQGVLPLVGYNYGAKNVARARACIAYAAKLLMAVAFAVMILCELFGPQIMRAFLDTDEVVTAGTTIVRVHMLCAPLMATVLFVSTLCQAVGRWQYSLVFLTVRQLCVNIPLTILMTHTIGLAGTAGAQPACDFICCVAALLIYRHVFVTSISREEAGAGAAS